jgi:hypothetical protein
VDRETRAEFLIFAHAAVAGVSTDNRDYDNVALITNGLLATSPQNSNHLSRYGRRFNIASLSNRTTLVGSFPDFDDDVVSIKALQGILPSTSAPHAHVRFWFRGQSKASWPATPGIFRNGGIKWKTEKHLNSDFGVFGAALLSDAIRNADVYFVQQHYGMPTRLLDWTQSPLAALYFAARDHIDTHDGRIFFIDAYECKSRNSDKRIARLPSRNKETEFHGIATSGHPIFKEGIRPIFEWHDDTTAMPDFIIPVLPHHLGGRVNFQHSCFTFHNDNHKEFTDKDNSGIKTYRIPKKCKKDILEELSMLRINEFSIYGDLSSLAKHLKQAHGVK